MGKLAASVTLRGQDFELVTFPADSTPPAWAQAQIRNPKAWVGGEAPALAGGPPPKGGPGSGKEAWVAYAAGKVEVTEEMTRDDIIAALTSAGVPTE